jgi:hypothetical protein
MPNRTLETNIAIATVRIKIGETPRYVSSRILIVINNPTKVIPDIALELLN